MHFDNSFARGVCLYDKLFLVSVPCLKHKIQRIEWHFICCTRQISSYLLNCRGWWKQRGSCYKVSLQMHGFPTMVILPFLAISLKHQKVADSNIPSQITAPFAKPAMDTLR